MSQLFRPFSISISDSTLHDLRSRLEHTRWPEEATVKDWSQGVPLSVVQDLCTYWIEQYDWRHCEKRLNSYPQFVTEIDGVDIHFLYIRSKHSNALPMIMTHGWPGSIIEFTKVIEPLTDPTEHGATEQDAFHLILPTLPGYGFSGKPTTNGFTSARIAIAWTELMTRLGFERWVAQGGDWGADVVAALASNSPPTSLAAVHMNTAFFDAKKETRWAKTLSSGEERALELWERWERTESAYLLQQGTRPQTLGYSLADSPSGLLAWLFEKISVWSQHKGKDVFSVLSREEILDDIMIYWLTNTGTSSARLYWENLDATDLPIDIPVAVSQFPGDQTYVPRSWGERYYKNIIHWHDVEEGGHFAAWESPGLFVRELRACFAHIRQ
ncbi:hypothetical protein PV11_00358 [Exophiala sideris]|uniref:Epoxide hydrolase N-terminal domain-containing protein n=1 Tax=Exophiala sideris TaxID=1016849 RepID=A0A0D1W7D0_9EURO|nr:hypothetical protein PV11_00358 [Exophiala sideris]